MLAKKYRLRKNSEFVATYAQAKYVSSQYLTLNIGKPKPHNDFVSKVAFVVSKKIDKRAVVRNKIKRRMREAYKILINENPNFQKWMSAIFTAKADLINADLSLVTAQMRHALEKAMVKYD